MTSTDKRRCSATNRRGEPCASTVIGADGLCATHSPSTKRDMRELGRAGARARRRGPAAQLPEPERESLREKLKQLDHDTIVAAIERALAGGNESARVSAIKFLADLELYRPDDREQERASEAAHYSERLEQLIREHARRRRLMGQTELAQELEQAARELWQPGEVTAGGAVVAQDVSAEDARAVLEGLADRGLIRPPLRPRERDELAAKDREIDRLKTQLAEFTVVT